MLAHPRARAPFSIIAIVAVLGAAIFALVHRLTASEASPVSKPQATGVETAEVSRYKVPVSTSQPALGTERALVTVVEWCDLTGPGCRHSERLLAKLRKTHGDKMRHVWRHFPSEQNEACRDVHEVAHAVFEQNGKFWELRAALLDLDRSPTVSELDAMLTTLGLDPRVLRKDLERHAHAGYVVADAFFASKFGVTRAPALFVNGRPLEGELNEAGLTRLVQDELVRAEELAAQSVAPDKVYEEITAGGLWEVKGTPLARSER